MFKEERNFYAQPDSPELWERYKSSLVRHEDSGSSYYRGLILALKNKATRVSICKEPEMPSLKELGSIVPLIQHELRESIRLQSDINKYYGAFSLILYLDSHYPTESGEDRQVMLVRWKDYEIEVDTTYRGAEVDSSYLSRAFYWEAIFHGGDLRRLSLGSLWNTARNRRVAAEFSEEKRLSFMLYQLAIATEEIQRLPCYDPEKTHECILAYGPMSNTETNFWIDALNRVL
tara:strand:- start:551 stop:1246 length:696 start_codon:yes stop_codon:yes gene_type:complete